MKKLVWSQTQVAGGKSFTGVLPQPPSVNGPIGDIAAQAKALDAFGKVIQEGEQTLMPGWAVSLAYFIAVFL